MTEVIEYYKEAKTCPRCKVVMVFNSHDMKRHLTMCAGPRLHWRKSKYAKNEMYCFATEDKLLAREIQQVGRVVKGNYEFTLGGNGKYIKRRRINNEGLEEEEEEIDRY